MSTNFQIVTIPYCICINYHFLNVFVGRKNHMYTKYYKYHHLLFLYSKYMGISIIPVNHDLYIIMLSQPAIYTEVQLCTTCKVVNRMNDIQKKVLQFITFS